MLASAGNAKTVMGILQERNEQLSLDNVKLKAEVERDIARLGKLNAELVIQANHNSDLTGQLSCLQQNLADLQAKFDESVSRNFKQIQKLQDGKNALESILNEQKTELAHVQTENNDKQEKIMSKAEKIVEMKKSNKAKCETLKGQAKEYFDKLQEAYKLLQALRAGTTTLDDIDKDFLLDDFDEGSSSDVDDGSDEELLENQQNHRNVESKRNPRMNKRDGTEEKDRNGDVIPFSNEELRRRSQAKEHHASSSSKRRGEGDSEKARYSERSIGGGRNRSKKGTKKRSGALEAEESSEEVVDGVRRKKTKAHRKKDGYEEQDSETSFELDQKTGVKTKRR